MRRLALGRPSAPTLGEGLLAGLLAGLGLLGLGTGVALAAPAGSLSTKAQAVRTAPPALASPADTTRPPLAPGPPPAPVRRTWAAIAPAQTIDYPVVAEPRIRVFPLAQTAPRPPRRGGASTVVIEKDKKGRVVRLLVDGQPVGTATPGKKAKRGKAVRTVEVVRVPGPPEPLERPEVRSFSFNLSTDAPADQARQAARQGLREALRNPDLNAEQRQELAQELRRLKMDITTQRADLNRQLGDFNRQFKEFHFDLRKDLTEEDGRTARVRPHFHTELRYNARGRARMRVRPGDADARQAERDAEQANRDAQQADRDGEQADREDKRADAAARRAELRARIAADEAELRVLNGSSGPGLRPFSWRPGPPRAPRAPLAPPVPFAPQVPQVPTPPAPPAAPNTARLREELRRDGLIKAEKHFSFELNDEGGRVDGQELTEAQVARYRKLLNQSASKGKGHKSSFSISVDEQ